MTILDNSFLDRSLRDTNNKLIKCHENKDMLHQLSYNNNAIFNYFAINCSSYEAALIIKANNKYIKSKNQKPNRTRYGKRQLIMVELGLNYNKLSYKHPCVVIEDLGDRVFVVPCTSGKAPTYTPPYDPEIDEKPKREIRNGYLEGDELDGFHHLTTIIIKEAVCIDKSQIVSTIKENGKLKKITPEKFKEINFELHKILFSWQHFNMNKMEKELTELKISLEKTQIEKLDLEEQINTLKLECDRLLKENIAMQEVASE